MSHALYEAATQYGMEGIIFLGFLLVLSWVIQVNKEVLKNTFAVNNKLLVSMEQERSSYQDIQRCFSENIKEISAYNKAFHKTVEEAHKFQREEHKEMIASLGRINGYKS